MDVRKGHGEGSDVDDSKDGRDARTRNPDPVGTQSTLGALGPTTPVAGSLTELFFFGFAHDALSPKLQVRSRRCAPVCDIGVNGHGREADGESLPAGDSAACALTSPAASC